MNVIYAVIEENPEWNAWADGDQVNASVLAPAESVVHLKVSGVDEPILTLDCEGVLGKFVSGRRQEEAIADTLREFFSQVKNRITGG